jgi:hypothetical protein
VLDLFQRQYMPDAAEMYASQETEKEAEVVVENLAMLLLFFKTRLANMDLDEALKLVEHDYRCNVLLSMTMDRYM